jgi:hypothetical protein
LGAVAGTFLMGLHNVNLGRWHMGGALDGFAQTFPP